MSLSFSALVAVATFAVTEAISHVVDGRGHTELLRKEALRPPWGDGAFIPDFMTTTGEVPTLPPPPGLKTFKDYDLNNNSFIEKQEIDLLVKDMSEGGTNITELGIDVMRFDSDQDGKLSETEFDDIARWYYLRGEPVEQDADEPMIPPKSHHPYGRPEIRGPYSQDDPPGTGGLAQKSLLEVGDMQDAKDNEEDGDEEDDDPWTRAQDKEDTVGEVKPFDFNMFYHPVHDNDLSLDKLKKQKAAADAALANFQIGSIMNAADAHDSNSFSLVGVEGQSKKSRSHPQQAEPKRALADLQGQDPDDPWKTVPKTHKAVADSQLNDFQIGSISGVAPPEDDPWKQDQQEKDDKAQEEEIADEMQREKQQDIYDQRMKAVDEMEAKRKRNMRYFKHQFMMLDRNNDGYLERPEVETALEEANLPTDFDWQKYDDDFDGKLSFREMLHLNRVESAPGSANGGGGLAESDKDPADPLVDDAPSPIFVKFDKNKNGYLEPSELVAAVTSQWPTLTSNPQVAQLVQRADTDADGRLSNLEAAKLADMLNAVEWNAEFEKFDKDGSGDWEPREVVAWMASNGFPTSFAWQKFDDDADGKLSNQEASDLSDKMSDTFQGITQQIATNQTDQHLRSLLSMN